VHTGVRQLLYNPVLSSITITGIKAITHLLNRDYWPTLQTKLINSATVMTSTQFLVIIGTIYIAPHINKYWCQAMGALFLVVAVSKDLGWL
jgi:hypothetical protein